MTILFSIRVNKKIYFILYIFYVFRCFIYYIFYIININIPYYKRNFSLQRYDFEL